MQQDLIVQEPNTDVQDINVDEVLREYGMDNVDNAGTVIQNRDSTVVIPANTSTSTLEPPPVDNIQEEDILNELLDENPIIDSDSNSYQLEETVQDETDNTSNTNVTEVVTNLLGVSNKLSTEEALKYLIPVNTKSVEVDDTTSRFSGASWFEAIKQSTILIAGMGGIGSNVIYPLSRMKPLQIFIYDDDTVERANLSGQMYTVEMVGKKKVNAMARLASDFSEYNGIFAVPTKFDENTSANDIMICGFDNMSARKTFFNSWINHVIKHKNPENCLFIDGRLDIESFQVFCIKGNDNYNINRYATEFLFGDWQAESLACSMKQTTYCANLIGSTIVNLFTNFIANTLNPVIERALPFKTYYDASLMYLKTED